MKKSDKNISGGDGLQPNSHASKVLVSSSSPMAKVCCSIEMEPRTLREGQLTHARVTCLIYLHLFSLLINFQDCKIAYLLNFVYFHISLGLLIIVMLAGGGCRRCTKDGAQGSIHCVH